MKIDQILKLLGYLSGVIKTLYNRMRPTPEFIEEAKDGDQRGIEEDVFGDSGKSSGDKYASVQTREAKKRR